MDKPANKIGEILEKFTIWVNSTEAKQHLAYFEKEKKEVRDLMSRLSKMDRKSSEFTELVLYGLLPYNKTKFAKRISIFPAFLNVRLFFKKFNYGDEEWNTVANKIFDLALQFQKNPERFSELISDFIKDKYSRRFLFSHYFTNLFESSDYSIV